MVVFCKNPPRCLSALPSAGILRLALVFACCISASSIWAACTGASPTWSTTPDYASVSTCVTQASNGDTINISTGSATWTSTLSWSTKGITLLGAGAGSTNITNGLAADNSTPLIKIGNTGNNFVRFSGLTLVESDNQIPLLLNGPISKIRIDHITINKGDAIHANFIDKGGTGPVYGVVDSSKFIDMKRSYYATDVRSTDSPTWGTAAWIEYNADPNYPSSGKFLFFEDDQFTWDGSNTDTNVQGALYGGYGGKTVFRHNTMSGLCGGNTGTNSFIDAHGDGPDYGTILYIFYNNIFNENSPCSSNIIGMRGGRIISHDNTFNANGDAVHLEIYWPQCADQSSEPGGCEILTHRIAYSYLWNNTICSENGTGCSTPSNQSVVVANLTTSSPELSTDFIKLNQQYFLAAPQTGQTYFPYSDYTYPHPLRGNTSAGPSPPANTPTAASR